jgi:putative phage-type endonuclease
MVVYDQIKQGTSEWLEIRKGVPTASQFATVMAKGEGKTRTEYMLKLAGEVITGERMFSFSNKHTERGHEFEPEARELYMLQSDLDVREIGFIRADYSAGASPDALVGNDGLLEVKTKLPHIQLEVLLSGKVPTGHIKQIQGQMLIAEREWCDFVSYWPGLPLYIKRVFRDESLISEMRKAIYQFNDELNEIVNKVAMM